MSDATPDVAAPVLGAPAPNGAAGAQVPAGEVVKPPVDAKPDVPGQAANEAAVKALAEKTAAEAAAKTEADKKLAAEKSAADTKAADEKKAAESKVAADKAWAEFKFKAPEGVTLDEGQAKSFSELARAEGLSPEAAQKFVDFQGKQAAAQAKASAEALKAERNGWISSLKADKDIGGEKWNDTVVLANKGLERFVDADTRKFLIATGLDAHPGLVKAFHAIGKALKDDSIGRDGLGGQGPTDGDRQRAMYPNSPGLFPKS